MQKYILIFAILITAVLFLPREAQAQWTNPYGTYRMNDMIRRTPKKNAARKSTKKISPARRSKIARKVVRKKARRASQQIDLTNPKFKFVLNNSKRSDIAS